MNSRTIFNVACVALLLSVFWGCGEDGPAPSIDCGRAETLTAAPAVPTVVALPSVTNQPTVALFGDKSVNTAVAVNNVEVVAFDCSATWSAELSLSEGVNVLDFTSINRTGAQSASASVGITLDTAKPAPPAVTVCSASTSASPCTLSGTKAAAEAVWINDRLAVGPGGTGWSYQASLLAAGDNTFSVRIQDAAGNRSDPTDVTVNFAGTPQAPPRLVFPLANAGVVTSTPTFRWNSVMAYQLQVDDAPDFSSPVFQTSGTAQSATSSPLSAGRYFWRVGRVDGSNIFYGPARGLVIGHSRCDVDGDGFDDLVVGSYENDNTAGTNAGRVFIFFGGSSGVGTTPGLQMTGEAAGDRFGISVACAGDVNGDGFADVLAGAFLSDAGGAGSGRAYLFFGNSRSLMDGNADLVFTGQAAGDQLGVSVSGAGDVNGDGFDDILVGAYLNDGGGTDAGRAYLYLGGSAMDNLPDAVYNGEAEGDQMGIRVARAGDVNGDFFDDVIIAANLADVGGLTDAGKAYIFFGGPNIIGRNASQADVILEGSAADDAFASVGAAGDLDNDGYEDVVVGASAFTTGSGSEDCTNFQDDDGDGLVDRRDSDCYLGRAYVFKGGPGLMDLTGALSADSADFTLTRPAAADGFGFSVASAGDVDSDGYSDLLVGAFLSDKTGSGTKENCSNAVDDEGDGLVDFDDPECLIEDAGRAYLYKGGAAFDTTADITFLGEASAGSSSSAALLDTPLSGQFGFALGGAGSLNGDRFGDIVIGAYLHDTGVVATATVDPADVGKVYVFAGSALPATPTPQSVDAGTFGAATRITGSDDLSSSFGKDNGFGISVQ